MSKKNKIILVTSCIVLVLIMYMLISAIYSLVYTFNLNETLHQSNRFNHAMQRCIAIMTCPIACSIYFADVMFYNLNFDRLIATGCPKSTIKYWVIHDIVLFAFSVFAHFYLSYAEIIDNVMAFVILVYYFNSVSFFVLLSIFWQKFRYLKKENNDPTK